MRAFPLKSGPGQGGLLSLPLFNSGQRTKKREINKSDTNREGRSYIAPSCRQNNPMLE